jgi:hypothetical protein
MADPEDDETTHRPSLTDVGCSLADAEANIRRSLRAVGPIPAGERFGAEWRAVKNWCEEKGLILPIDVMMHPLTKLQSKRLIASPRSAVTRLLEFPRPIELCRESSPGRAGRDRAGRDGSAGGRIGFFGPKQPEGAGALTTSAGEVIS